MDSLPYPHMLVRADGVIALVASEAQARALPAGAWAAYPLPQPAVIPALARGVQMNGATQAVMGQSRLVYLRVLGDYDITRDAHLWRCDVWQGDTYGDSP